MKRFMALCWLMCGGTILVFSQTALEPRTAKKQVVLETALGSIVLEVFPDAAPNHVEKFLERMQNNFYVGTVFHRVVAQGIIQGGDPLSKDPAHVDQYGTGGLYELKREPNDLSHIRGTLSAVRVPGDPDSAGAQFFICVSDQIQLDGQYTAYGRVVEGMDVVEKISLLPADSQQKLIQRVEILKTSLRERPPPEEPPFINASEDELSRYRVLIKTELGEIEIAFNERDATEHVRQFLTFAQLGLYDGTPFHRVVPGFVIQGGSISMREEPPAAKYVHLIKNLVPEFSAKRKHLRGAVSMARGPELNSAVDSFFIVLEDQPRLDGQYTVFGRVVQGMDVVDMIALQPLAGERLVKPLKMKLEVVKVKE